MTAQPTTRIPTAPYGPHGPGYGAPLGGPGPVPPAFPPPPAAPRRRTGRTVGLVASAIVVLGGLAAAALALFGPRYVEPESVEREIVRITQSAVGVAATDISCPEDVRMQAGGTFACNATVDGQPLTFTARQDDDQGNVTFTFDRLLKLDDVTSAVADQVGRDIDIPVTVSCETVGRTVVVNQPGTPIDCTATNAADATDSAKITVTVDADGSPAYAFA